MFSFRPLLHALALPLGLAAFGASTYFAARSATPVTLQILSLSLTSAAALAGISYVASIMAEPRLSRRQRREALLMVAIHGISGFIVATIVLSAVLLPVTAR